MYENTKQYSKKNGRKWFVCSIVVLRFSFSASAIFVTWCIVKNAVLFNLFGLVLFSRGLNVLEYDNFL